MKRLPPALALLLVAACASPSDDAADASPNGAVDAGPADAETGRIDSHDFTFPEARFAEPNLVMQAGDRFVATLTSSPTNVYFNIHFHENNETTTYIEMEETSIEYDFEAPADGTFWILIGNRMSADPIDATLSLEMFGTTSLENWGDE